MKTRSLLLRLALALVAIAGLTSMPAQASTQDATSFINGIGTEALAAINNQKLTKEQKQTKLEGYFTQSVDIAWVGKFVLGAFWRQATDDQKAKYLKAYEKFLVLHYTSRFTDYTSGTFKITGAKDDGDDETTVSMQLISGDGKSEPVLVDYRVRKNAGGYKIFDVIVEGVSLIATQRSEFSSILNNKGLDYLIQQLTSRSLPVGN